MSLNVKDPEVYRLAQEISKVTGETLTGAVKTALKERYEKIQTLRKAPVADLLAIGKRAASNLKRPYMDHAELLYDEYGLPK